MSGVGKGIKTITSTGDALTDGVLYGYGWSDATITYAFPTLSSNYNYQGSSGELATFKAITLQQKNVVLNTLEQSFGTAANDGFSVEGFTNANFALGNVTSATLRFGQTNVASTAYAYMPGNYDQAGDMWFGTSYDYTKPMAGNYAYHTIMHEIGHALGLKHGHEAEGDFAALPGDYDSLEYSVMTYRSYAGADLNGYTYYDGSAPQTFMMADIAGLQAMYGADFTTNSGATVYKWKPGNGDTLVNGKIGVDALGAQIFATLWDGGGMDTYDLTSYTTAVKIDLAPGHASVFNSNQLANLGYGHFASGNIYNALLYKGDTRSMIENAAGGSGNDTIFGNVISNKLAGGLGNDTLNGAGGSDTLIGGGGADLFVFSNVKGKDTISDFVNGTDHIDLTRLVLDTIDDVLDVSSQVGKNILVTVDSDTSFVIANTKLAALDASDFLFA